ncbi:MAG: TIR domain-containing protein [Bacteroidia bacterium]|nr:TIR domain-containing protein [Bacteroidia bacterium]
MPTYIAFAADGNENMFESDIKYYRLITAWDAMKSRDFELINAHEKSSSIRKGSKEEIIKRTLRERLDKSKRMLLLVGDTTKFDNDFVPYEIEYAIDTCKLPVIVCYVNEKNRIITDPTPPTSSQLREHIPKALKDRMDNGTAKTLHIPFRQRIMAKALDDFSNAKLPTYAFGVYNTSIYDSIYKPNEI